MWYGGLLFVVTLYTQRLRRTWGLCMCWWRPQTSRGVELYPYSNNAISSTNKN